MNRFRELMIEMNCKDLPKAVELAKTAIRSGDDPDSVADQIRRNVPGLFYTRGRAKRV